MSWDYAGEFEFLPSSDSLWRNTPVPLELRFNVLGISLTIAANAPAVIDLANEVFGDWGATESEIDAPKVRLTIVLHTAVERTGEPYPLICRAHEDYLLLSKGSSQGFGDRTHGIAAAYITANLLSTDRDTVRSCFLECLGLFLVCQHRRATLHAAAIVHNGRCVLLTGKNGVGKSTLAYACLRSGFGFLSDDIVYAQITGTGTTAWGCPWNLHLLPDAVHLFPELQGAATITQMNGECKLRIPVKQMRQDAAVTHLPIWGVCSLERIPGGQPRLCKADPTLVRAALSQFESAPMLDNAAIVSAADNLIEGRLAHLEFGDDLLTTVDALRRWMESI